MVLVKTLQSLSELRYGRSGMAVGSPAGRVIDQEPIG